MQSRQERVFFTRSTIHSVTSVQELLRLKKISFNSVVYWDLDNTILKPRNELGTVGWYHALQEIAKSKLGAALNLGLLKAIYHFVQDHIEAVEIEELTIKTIQLLSQIGISQRIITSRHHALKEITEHQLWEVGIYLSLSITKNNIIFCDGQDKGAILMERYRFYSPAHIVMIDSQESNLLAVQEAAKNFKSRFTGIHYQHLPESITSEQMLRANTQLLNLLQFMPPVLRAFVEELELDRNEEEVVTPRI
jgi:hypothetical protein